MDLKGHFKVLTLAIPQPSNKAAVTGGLPTVAAISDAVIGPMPAHLPRTKVTLTPEDTACPCCRATMTVIGEDTSKWLDVIRRSSG